MRADGDSVLGTTELARPAPKPWSGSIGQGEVIGERYRLVACVGSGGQGEVYRAEDVVIEGHVVALKILHARAATPEDRDAQLRELRMLATVSHPAVVQFKDHGWLGGRLWFVMPWYEGGTLEDVVPLDRREARRIFETLAAGLAAVHAKGLRHQDIKPSNVFLAKIDGLESTMPILLDFGVAAGEGEILVAGSPDYFAPELARSWPTAGDVGAPADVFALALTLRNVLDPTPLPAMDAFDKKLLDRRATEALPPPTGAELVYLRPTFERWLSLDPHTRPTATEFLGELAILTAPEDRQAERRATLKRVAPFVVVTTLVVAVLGTWGYRALVDARKDAVAEASERREAEQAAETATARADSLGAELGSALARADTASRRTSDALARLDDAEAAMTRAEGNIDDLRRARDRLRSTLAEAHAEIEAQTAAVADMQASLQRLTAQLGDTQRERDGLRTERDGLRTERDGLRTERDGLRTERDGLRTERDGLRTERDGLRTERDALTVERDNLRGEQARRDDELATWRTRATNAEGALDAANTARTAAEGRLAESQARVRELEASIEEARRRPVVRPEVTPTVSPSEPTTAAADPTTP